MMSGSCISREKTLDLVDRVEKGVTNQAVTYEDTETRRGEVICARSPENRGPGYQVYVAQKPTLSTMLPSTPL